MKNDPNKLNLMLEITKIGESDALFTSFGSYLIFIKQWRQFQDKPIGIIKLDSKTAVLFSSYYKLYSKDANDKEKPNLKYTNLFMNYNEENLISYAYFDSLDKKYLFIGSKFNFMQDFMDLDE